MKGMEKRHRDLSELQPRTETRVNAVLNGLLNGITIGSAPLGVFSLRRVFFNKEIPAKWLKISAGLSVIGGAIGALLGIREGERLTSFRNAVVNNVQSLGDDVEELKVLHEQQIALQKQTEAAPQVSQAEPEGTVKAAPEKTQENVIS